MSKPLCFVSIAMHSEAEKNLRKHYEITDDAELLLQAEAAIVYVVPDEWTGDNRLKLKAVGCHACSDAFSVWANSRGIAIAMAANLRRTVAEHTLALAMAAARGISQADLDVRSGQWQDHTALKIRHSGINFQHKTFGILGMGRIGRELAQLLRGFQMRILYYDLRPLEAEQERALGVENCSFETLLRQSDFFAVLIPLNENTRGFLGKKAFASMKPGCIFVNTARAALCVYNDFVDAMKKGIIGAAALDVLWDEGTGQPEELMKMKNLIVTPHLGGSTFECDMTLVKGVIESEGYV